MSAPQLAPTDTSDVTAQASDDVTHPSGLRWSKTSIGPIWGCEDNFAQRFMETIESLFKESLVFNPEASPWLDIANKLIWILMHGFAFLVTLMFFIQLPLLDLLFYLPTQLYRYRRLEVVCRYGDYLAERLDTLRAYVADKKLENKHLLARNWTEISAVLDKESAQRDRPCHDLIKDAAKGLGWDRDLTIFMAREYGSRNSLVHNNLTSLVEAHDWILQKRCEKDQATLGRILFIDSIGTNGKSNRENWGDVINSFRERFVNQSEDNPEPQLNPIIDEGLREGLRDWKSLNKLADVRKDLPAEDRKTEIERLKGERDKTEVRNRLLAKLESDPELKDAAAKMVKEELKTSKLEKKIEGLEIAQVSTTSRLQVAVDKLKTMGAIIRDMNGRLRTPEMQAKLRDSGLLESLKDLELLDGLLELGIDITAGEAQLEANSDDEARVMRDLFDIN